jgi:hypothetical protein
MDKLLQMQRRPASQRPLEDSAHQHHLLVHLVHLVVHLDQVEFGDLNNTVMLRTATGIF